MSRCKNCGIVIMDPTEKCPFCNLVLERDAENQSTEEAKSMYPNAALAIRKYRTLERIVLFASLVGMSGLVLANYFWQPFYAWTVIIGLITIYVNTVLRLSITGRYGYQSKTLVLTFLGVGILIGIDALTGYNRWSINFVLPAAVLFLDFVYFVLVICNRRNWQSYLVPEIFQIIFSAVLVIFYMTGLITELSLVLIALLVSFLLFSGTLIFGGDRARRELQRRFHV